MKKSTSSFILLSFTLLLSMAAGLTMLTSFLMPTPLTGFKIPYIVTEKKPAEYCLSPEYMLNAWYDIELIRPFCDTLNLKSKDETISNNFFDDPSKLKQFEYSNMGLMIVVDTTNELAMTKKPIWASYLFHHNLGSKSNILQDDTLIQDVKSFPVFIANTSANKNAMLETQDGSFMMIIEARDESRNWKPIEYWSNSWCGNSYSFVIIPPKHFAFTRGVRCSGNYLTNCRLKVFNEDAVIYSNEFRMQINKTQFEKPSVN